MFWVVPPKNKGLFIVAKTPTTVNVECEVVIETCKTVHIHYGLKFLNYRTSHYREPLSKLIILIRKSCAINRNSFSLTQSL